jgi:RecG-like helicase
MGLKEIEQDLKMLKENTIATAQVNVNNKEFKLPSKVKGKIKRKNKEGKILIVFFRNNKTLEFRYAPIIGGIVHLSAETPSGQKEYKFSLYEPEAVYIFNNKIGAIGVFEWRLTPIGGLTEEYRSRLVGDQVDQKLAEELGLNSYGQETIIRAIEQAELSKDEKKKGSFSIIWIILGLIAVGLVLQQLGVF